jgi:hypothetical protein
LRWDFVDDNDVEITSGQGEVGTAMPQIATQAANNFYRLQRLIHRISVGSFCTSFDGDSLYVGYSAASDPVMV